MADLDVAEREDSGLGMSNYDHSIDDGLEKALRAGLRGEHAAWNFNGLIWFGDDGQFHERVSRYHVPVAVASAPTLRELMEKVNNEHGWE